MINHNDNQLIAIDIFTNGPNIEEHDICSIGIILVNERMEYNNKIPPFNINITPININVYDEKHIPLKQYRDLLNNSIQQEQAINLLEYWFQNLKLKETKRLLPLAHNWAIKQKFIEKWLGYHTYNSIFDWRYRDILSICGFENDFAEYRTIAYPYPKLDYRYICSQCIITHRKWDNLLESCVHLIEAYMQILTRRV